MLPWFSALDCGQSAPHLVSCLDSLGVGDSDKIWFKTTNNPLFRKVSEKEKDRSRLSRIWTMSRKKKKLHFDTVQKNGKKASRWKKTQSAKRTTLGAKRDATDHDVKNVRRRQKRSEREYADEKGRG